MDGDGGFAEYRRLILSELERHEAILKGIQNELQALRGDLVTLKVKVAVLGAGAGAVPLAAYGLVKFILGGTG